MQSFLIGYQAKTDNGLLDGKYLTRALSAYEALKDFDNYMLYKKHINWITKRWFINE
jgi:hypothetical protein